jgi:hypothetical protein
MYVDISSVRQGDKIYTRYLLRESFREDGKVRHRTIANLSGCSAAEIEAIRLALRHKDNLSALTIDQAQIVIKQGLSYGAVYVARLALLQHSGRAVRVGSRSGKSLRGSSIRDRACRRCGWHGLTRPRRSLD